MTRSQKAFSLIELVFIIVIIGILAVVAVPRLMMTRDDAHIAKNIEYITGIMQEISTYTISKNGTEEDLTLMSPLLGVLKQQGKVILSTAHKRATLKIGEQNDCMIIQIDSNETSEVLNTSFTPSNDRVCHLTQKAIKSQKYTIVLRGRLIKY